MKLEKTNWIIFLDIDGVIATVESEDRSLDSPFDDKAVYWVNELLAKYDLQIVVSSDWRLRYPFAELIKILSPLKAKVISSTPALIERGEEIKKWLETNDWGEKYLVIDDYVDDITPYIYKEHIVEVEVGFGRHGFSKKHFIEAIQKIEFIGR